MQWRDRFWGADLGHWVTLCFGQVDADTGGGAARPLGRAPRSDTPAARGCPAPGAWCRQTGPAPWRRGGFQGRSREVRGTLGVSRGGRKQRKAPSGTGTWDMVAERGLWDGQIWGAVSLNRVRVWDTTRIHVHKVRSSTEPSERAPGGRDGSLFRSPAHEHGKPPPGIRWASSSPNATASGQHGEDTGCVQSLSVPRGEPLEWTVLPASSPGTQREGLRVRKAQAPGRAAGGPHDGRPDEALAGDHER